MLYKLKYMPPLVTILIVGLNLGAFSQNLDKYVIIHKNRKNDSQIKPSPLASGYEKNEAYEFGYEPIPTEAMKKRVKNIIKPSIKEERMEEEPDIFGAGYENELFLEQSSTLLQELDEEAAKAILNQKASALAAASAKRKINIASYAASVEAKKQREKEAALAAIENQKQTSSLSQPQHYEEEYEESDLEEEEASNSLMITGSQGGKIQIKSTNNP